ncbi:hypothetical protein [Pontibacter oryzae]|nr:hypothetical protein [Pontibacter oryzae]
MKTQLLPHYFRIPGMVVFILASIPSVIAGFVDAQFYTYETYALLSKHTIYLLDILGILGLAVYALSQDRVYDELLQRLRLEAIKTTFVVSMAVVILSYIIFPDFKIHPSYLINLQVLCYSLLYYIRKNSMPYA